MGGLGGIKTIENSLPRVLDRVARYRGVIAPQIKDPHRSAPGRTHIIGRRIHVNIAHRPIPDGALVAVRQRDSGGAKITSTGRRLVGQVRAVLGGLDNPGIHAVEDEVAKPTRLDGASDSPIGRLEDGSRLGLKRDRVACAAAAMELKETTCSSRCRESAAEVDTLSGADLIGARSPIGGIVEKCIGACMGTGRPVAGTTLGLSNIQVISNHNSGGHDQHHAHRLWTAAGIGIID